MKMNKALMTSDSPHYATPDWLYAELDAEFNFDDDPCPLTDNGIEGLLRSWGKSTYCNPPYGRHISKWMMKAYQESEADKTVVCLIPSRTDTKWWHEYVMRAAEIRLVKGRITFQNCNNGAPFPSAIIVFQGGHNGNPKITSFETRHRTNNLKARWKTNSNSR